MMAKKMEEKKRKTEEMLQRQRDLAAPQIPAVDAIRGDIEMSG